MPYMYKVLYTYTCVYTYLAFKHLNEHPGLILTIQHKLIFHIQL